MACNDRPNHQPPWPAGTTASQQLVVPILACHNGSRRPCSSRQHARGFTACGSCRRHTRVMLGLQQPPRPLNAAAPWNHERLVRRPLNIAGQTGLSPEAPGPGHTIATPNWWQTQAELNTGNLGAGRGVGPPFDGFLTRLCLNCENLVLCEEFYRRPGIAMYTNNQTQSDLQWWEHNFQSSCTCRRKLGAGTYPGQDILCKPHRQRQWNDLVAARDERDRWLRGIESVVLPAGPNGRPAARKKLRDASAATLQDRVNNPGWLRACRCGDEIGHALYRAPQALMCMGCEGYIVLVPRVWPGPAATRPAWGPDQFIDELARAGDLSVPRRVTGR